MQKAPTSKAQSWRKSFCRRRLSCRLRQTQRRPIQRGMPNFHLRMVPLLNECLACQVGWGAFASEVIYMRDVFCKMIFSMIALLAFGVGTFCIEGASRFHAFTWMTPNALTSLSQQRQKQISDDLGKPGATT
ncbi:hypothetical protein PIB30_026229 [Stylosanthes scabra]|uniref:Uncharacterized protein n=1 Tax=Stylosanthes scabra TaxID=79078 RepID=A0ABU6Q9S4_9FABA|nr:hypothetical protein [Stylosanthes scabra]